MNNISSFQCKEYIPPQIKSFLSPKSLVFWGLNILTLGLYSGGETFSKHRRIKVLNLVQKDLHIQAAKLKQQWNDLEIELTNVLDHLRSSYKEDKEDLEDLRDRIGKLSLEKDKLEEKGIQGNVKLPTKLSEIVFGTISFVGHLIGNILTVGLYGTYQNYSLKNRILVLEAQNAAKKKHFEKKREIKFSHLQKIIDFSFSYIQLKEKNNSLSLPSHSYKKTIKTEPYSTGTQKNLDTVDKESQSLRVKLDAMKTSRLSVENELTQKKQDIDQLNKIIAGMKQEEIKLKQKHDQFQKDLDKNETELKKLKKSKQKEIFDLRMQLFSAVSKVAKVKKLEREISDLQGKIPVTDAIESSTRVIEQEISDSNATIQDLNEKRKSVTEYGMEMLDAGTKAEPPKAKSKENVESDKEDREITTEQDYLTDDVFYFKENFM